MLELGQKTKSLFLSFIDAAYKKNKFMGFMELEQLHLIEKTMERYLANPSQLYQKLISKKGHQSNQGKTVQYKKPKSPGAKFTNQIYCDSDSKQIQDLLNEDIKCSQKQNTNEAMILFQQQIGQTILKKHIQPIKRQNGQIMVQNYMESDAQSDFSFEQAHRLNLQTRKLSQNYANIHFSGLYSDLKSKFRTTKKGQKLSIPLLIIKYRNSPKEYVIKDCKAILEKGAVEELHAKLTQYESQSQS